MSWRPLLIVAALAVGAAPTTAVADAVRLSEEPYFGQGWMFLDGDDGRCKVVTARHVAFGDQGEARHLSVLTERGREWVPSVPRVISEELDIASMRVPAADDPSLCGTGRLSPIGASRRLRALSGGYILLAGQTETVRIPVDLRAASMAGDESRFAVRPALRTDHVAKGWSGSAVMDDEGPLGIVTNAGDDNEALAVRVDVIRRAMALDEATNPLPVSRSGRPSLTVLAGRTPDQAQGPGRVFDDVGWRVQPLHRTVVLVTTFDEPTQVRSVEVDGAEDAGRQAIAAVAIATSAELAGAWIDVNRCETIGTPTARCGFAPRTVRNVRLVFTTAGDTAVSLRRLVIR